MNVRALAIVSGGIGRSRRNHLRRKPRDHSDLQVSVNIGPPVLGWTQPAREVSRQCGRWRSASIATTTASPTVSDPACNHAGTVTATASPTATTGSTTGAMIATMTASPTSSTGATTGATIGATTAATTATSTTWSLDASPGDAQRAGPDSGRARPLRVTRAVRLEGGARRGVEYADCPGRLPSPRRPNPSCNFRARWPCVPGSPRSRSSRPTRWPPAAAPPPPTLRRLRWPGRRQGGRCDLARRPRRQPVRPAGRGRRDRRPLRPAGGELRLRGAARWS